MNAIESWNLKGTLMGISHYNHANIFKTLVMNSVGTYTNPPCSRFRSTIDLYIRGSLNKYIFFKSVRDESSPTFHVDFYSGLFAIPTASRRRRCLMTCVRPSPQPDLSDRLSRIICLRRRPWCIILYGTFPRPPLCSSRCVPSRSRRYCTMSPVPRSSVSFCVHRRSQRLV